MYANDRYGYFATLPSGFTKESESANGDGATFEDKNLDIECSIFGRNNISGLDASAIQETWWNGSSNSTSGSGDNWVSLEQFDGDEVEYHFAYVGTGSIVELQMEGDARNLSEFEAAASSIANSIIPGDLKSSH